jgi:hypothetical protein
MKAAVLWCRRRELVSPAGAVLEGAGVTGWREREREREREVAGSIERKANIRSAINFMDSLIKDFHYILHLF